MLNAARGPEHWSKNEDWQVGAIVVLADGRRDHFLSYVANAGGSYRDGVRVEKLGQAVYEDAGLLEGKPEGMDRELMRDYVVKPLVELGIAFEAIWTKQDDEPTLLLGHLRAKSPNCVYRLADEVIELFDAPTESSFDDGLKTIVASLPELQGKKLEIQRIVRDAQFGQPHNKLVMACVSALGHLGPGFAPVFMDVGDGKRITAEHCQSLSDCGLTIELSDTLPDAILADIKARRLIGVEAVTSDGEFDTHRLDRFNGWARRHGYIVQAAITAYPDCRAFAARQAKHDNIGFGSHIWFMDRPDWILRKEDLGSIFAL